MYQDIINYVSLFFSIFGAILIFYGGLRAIIKIIKVEILKRSYDYNLIRADFTSKIVLSLEFFIAADLIRTVVGYSLDKEAKEILSGQ